MNNLSEAPLLDNFDDQVARHYSLTLGRDEGAGDHHYLYEALALSLRDRLVNRWHATREQFQTPEVRRVSYLSMEFLIGRSLHNAILALELEGEVRAALEPFSCTLEELETAELDAGLGNGGLGRLAACFLDMNFLTDESTRMPRPGTSLRKSA